MVVATAFPGLVIRLGGFRALNPPSYFLLVCSSPRMGQMPMALVKLHLLESLGALFGVHWASINKALKTKAACQGWGDLGPPELL